MPSCLIIVENLPVPFDRRVWQEAKALANAGWHVSVVCPSLLTHPGRRGNYRRNIHLLPPGPVRGTRPFRLRFRILRARFGTKRAWHGRCLGGTA